MASGCANIMAAFVAGAVAAHIVPAPIGASMSAKKVTARLNQRRAKQNHRCNQKTKHSFLLLCLAMDGG